MQFARHAILVYMRVIYKFVVARFEMHRVHKAAATHILLSLLFNRLLEY